MSNLAGVLLQAAEVDLSDEAARAIFEREVPAVVQRLAELGEGKADFFAFGTVDVEARDALHTVQLKLNEAARTARHVLYGVAGGRLEDGLSAPLSHLFDRVAAAAGSALENHNEGLGAPRAEPGGIDWSEITIDRIEFHGIPPAHLEFEFSGEFTAIVPASVVRDSPIDGDLEDLQGEVVATGRFGFTLAWDPSEPIGEFFFDGVWLEQFESDTWIEGIRQMRWEDVLGPKASDEGPRSVGELE